MKHELLTKLTSFMKGLEKGDNAAIISGLQDAVAYLTERVAICEEIIEAKTGNAKLHLSDDQKRRLARAGRKLNALILSEIERAFAPSTLMDWHRQLIGDKYNSVGENQKKRGRKPISEELRDLIITFAEHNPNWGYRRIASYLVYLGYDVTHMTVKRVMNNFGLFPTRNQRTSGSWQRFIDAHKDVLASCDFATYELATPDGLIREHILFFEDITTREVWRGGITHAPNAAWMAQVGREQCDMFDGKLLGMAYLIHDSDTLFKSTFPTFLTSIGCAAKRTPPHMPECNGHIESFIKTWSVTKNLRAILRLVLEREISYHGAMKHELLTKLTSFMKGLEKGDNAVIISGLQDAVAYLTEKVAICEEIIEAKTGNAKLHLSDDQKRRLAYAGQKLNALILSEIERAFSPATLMDWHRQLIGDKYNSVGENQKKRGRKPISEELRDLIITFAEHNPNWGYRRIASYLVYLGYDVTHMTVKRVMNNFGLFPTRNQRTSGSWRRFIDAHKDVLASCDFATYELATPNGLVREHILFFENIATREVWCGGITHSPNAAWMAQVGREQCDMFDGKLLGMAYLIHDSDTLFKSTFPTFLTSIGCAGKRTPPHMPECNGHIESFIKTWNVTKNI